MSWSSVPYCNLEDMGFDCKFEDAFEFEKDIVDKLTQNDLEFLDESKIEMEERNIVIATDDATYPLNYEWTGFMETNVLEMKHEFSPKLQLKDTNASKASLSVSHITHYQLGLKSCFSFPWLFVFIFALLTSASSTETNVTVQHLTVMVGQQVTLHCSVDHPDPIIWRHKPVGTESLKIVYFDDSRLLGEYKSGGRHSIKDGTNDLVITNVTVADAGKYTCEGKELEEHSDVHDIVILKSMPSWSSNIVLDDIIGENDCGIDPDLLRLHCSVVYHGNFPPRLLWQNSGGEHAMIGTNVSIPIPDGTNNSTRSTLTVTANMKLNNTYFTCQVADSQSDGIVPECRTDELTVHSPYNSSVAPEINMQSQKEISCAANSSQPCNYQWTHQNKKYKIAINGSTLTFQDVSSGDGIYECQAECRLRGQICLTMPLRISVVAGGMNNFEKTVCGSTLQYAVIGVLSVFLVVMIFLAIVLRRKILAKTRKYEDILKKYEDSKTTISNLRKRQNERNNKDHQARVNYFSSLNKNVEDYPISVQDDDSDSFPIDDPLHSFGPTYRESQKSSLVSSNPRNLIDFSSLQELHKLK